MAFGEFILTNGNKEKKTSCIYIISEWLELVKSGTTNFMKVFGVKERTARGYAVVVAALRYIYDRNEDFFLNRGHSWDEFMQV